MNIIIEQVKKNPPKDSNRVVAVESTIAGYHVFKVRPLAGMQFPLILQREKDNPVHANAVMVKSAPREKYPKTVGDSADKDGRDIFAKEIGRCPRFLADIVSPLIDSNSITEGRAVYTGVRMFMGRNAGGGQHLQCLYLFKAKDVNAANQLNNLLGENAYKSFLLSS